MQSGILVRLLFLVNQAQLLPSLSARSIVVLSQVVLGGLDVDLGEEKPGPFEIVHVIWVVTLLRQISNALQLIPGLRGVLLNDKTLRHRQERWNVVLIVV